MTVQSMGTQLQLLSEGSTPLRVGNLTKIGALTPTSEEIDVTTLDAVGGMRRYVQGFRDPGALEIEGYHDGGDAGQAALRALYASGESRTFAVVFTDGTKATFTAYVKEHSLGGARVDSAVEFAAVLRLTGAIAFE